MRLMTIASVCAAAVLASEASATTLYVNKATGDDAAAAADKTRATRFRTIQAAVDCASAEDTISVAPGIYDEGGKYGDAVNKRLLSRVYISERIILKAESSDPADTHIVGASDTTETAVSGAEGVDGIGSNAVRCVQTINKGAVIRGFTIRDGRGHGITSNNHIDSYAGGVASVNKGSSDFYVIDCIITNCFAQRGSAFTGGTALRCKVVDSVGDACRWSVLVNCLFDGVRTVGSRNASCAADSTLYNCTMVNSDKYAFSGTVNIKNCVASYTGDNASSGKNAKLYTTITNSYVMKWASNEKYPGSDCIYLYKAMPNPEDTLFSPVLNDWHLVKDCTAQAIGEGELLANVSISTFAKDTGFCDPYIDLEGNAILKTGRIAPGCYQTLRDLTKTSGTMTFSAPVVVNGRRLAASFATANIVRTIEPLTEVTVRPYSTSSEFLCFESASFYRQVVFPQMDDTVWLMTPPSGTNVSVTSYMANSVVYVNPDPTIGSDETGTGSSAAPYLTILKACEKGSKTVVHCAPGIYTNDYKSYAGLNTRVVSRNYQRIKGAGIGKSIIMGQRATGTTGDDGRGVDAMRAVGLADLSCVQGFTIKDGYVKSGTDAESTKYGGLCKGSHSPTTAQGQVLDCLLSNGWAYRGAIGHGVTFMRCIFTGNNGNPGAGAQNQIRYGSVFSSLFYDNATTDGLLNTSDTPVNQTTLVGFGATDANALDKSLVTQNTLVYNIQQKGYQASGNGFFNGMTTDPKFATSFNAAYRLSKDSPALGAGVMPKWNMYCTDLEGKPFRYTNGKPTVGCYQNPGKMASLFQLQ